MSSSDAQIVCPNCSHEIKLTQSLATPLAAATPEQFQKHSLPRRRHCSQGGTMRPQQQLARDRETIEDSVAAISDNSELRVPID
jgi:hypothetical protein